MFIDFQPVVVSKGFHSPNYTSKHKNNCWYAVYALLLFLCPGYEHKILFQMHDLSSFGLVLLPLSSFYLVSFYINFVIVLNALRQGLEATFMLKSLSMNKHVTCTSFIIN